MQRLALPLTVLLVLLAGAAPSAAQQEESSLVFRIFNVQTLITQPKTYRAPRVLVGTDVVTDEDRRKFLEGDEASRALVTENELLEIIREAVEAELDDTEVEGSFLELTQGRLFVRYPAGVVTRIEGCLKNLQKQALRTYSLRIVLLPHGAGTQPDAPSPVPGSLLTTAQAAALLEKRGRIRAFQVSAFNGQGIVISEGEEENYVADYDVPTDADEGPGNPTVDVLATGTYLHLVPRANGASPSLVLSVGFASTRHQAGTEVLPVRKTAAGRLQLPALHYARIQTTALLPLGRWLLLRIPGTGPGRVLLLRATLLENGKPLAESKGEGKKNEGRKEKGEGS